MGTAFADVAPTLASAGLTEVDVAAEAVAAPTEKQPASPPVITKAKARILVKWASVHGSTNVPPAKQEYAGKTIPDMAFALGLNIDQVRTVLDEYRSVSSHDKEPVVKEPVVDGKTPVEII